MTSTQIEMLTPVEETAQTRTRSLWKNEFVAQGLIAIGIVVLWELIGRADFLYGLIPPFTDTLDGLWQIVSTGKVWPHVVTSAYEIGVGLTIAVVGGIVFGLAVGTVEYLRKVIEPLTIYFASVPKIILFPILLLFFGVGPGSKMAMGAISALVPIILNILVGMREVDSRYLDMARSLEARPMQVYRKIYLPAMIYPIFAGVRLGTALAIVGSLLGELKVSNGGLGYLTAYYYGQFVIPKMYAVLLLIFIGAAAINLVLSVVLARLTRFRASEVEEQHAIL